MSSNAQGLDQSGGQANRTPASRRKVADAAIPAPHVAPLASACAAPAPSAPRAQWGNRLALALLALLVFVPHFVNFQQTPWLGLPLLYSGDEPHYLLIINSFLNDGDLDISNNYASVHDGSSQAGNNWSGLRYMEHHSRMMLGERSAFWNECFHALLDRSQWERDGLGFLRPFPKPGSPSVPLGTPEYSYHPSGIAFLLAPFLLPFRGTRFLEPAAVLCSGVAILLGTLFFRLLLQGYSSSTRTINAITLITFIGTPIWFFGRSFFMEPYLMLFAVGAYALALRQGSAFRAGCLIALGMQLKPHFAILALPLLMDSLIRRQPRKLDLMLLPIAVSAAIVLFLNRVMYGSYFTPPQPFVFGSFREGALGLLFNAQFGLFFFAPSALLAIACWPQFARQNPRDAAVLITGFLIQYLMMSMCIYWNGWCYGPRHLVPVLPFLFVPLVKLPELSVFRSISIKALICVVLIASFLISGIGALNYRRYWVYHPLIEWLREHKPGSVPKPLLDYYLDNFIKP